MLANKRERGDYIQLCQTNQ